MEALKFAFSFDKRLTRSGFICTWLAIVASLLTMLNVWQTLKNAWLR